MSSTRDYIAQHYLGTGTNQQEKQTTITIDGKRVKKVKKRRTPTSSDKVVQHGTGTIIDEDDVVMGNWEDDTTSSQLGMLAMKASSKRESDIVDALGMANQDYDEEAPMIVAVDTSKIPTKTSAWKRVGDTETNTDNTANGQSIDDHDGPRMSSGERAGLQTAQQLRESSEAFQTAKRKHLEQLDPDAIGRGKETVYRDQSGRRIDIAAQRAELAAKKRAEEAQLEKEMEWGKGRVQRQAAELRKQYEEQEAKKPMARYADDEDLNSELKAQQRWNDPAAKFLTKKKSRGKRMPRYSGPPPPPNRFGILPGYRWDGVDRSNGFEKEYFARKAGKTVLAEEAYKWSVEDM